MIERTLDEMIADVDAAMRLTKTELGRAITRKDEAKKQAAACRVKLDELEERLEELKIRQRIQANIPELAEKLAATRPATETELDDLSEVQPPIVTQ